MLKAALVQMLERWAGSPECDTDSSFLARFLSQRDESAFAALVHRHGPLVYGTCLRLLGNRADADDAFQAVFFVLARRAQVLKRDRSVGPWLHGVALRVAKKLRGQIVRRRLREMSAARPERVEAAGPEDDFWAIIDEELARLSPSLREALVLCDLSGHSHSQAAASLGLAKGTITKRLAKARQELATRLRRRGITLGVGAVSTMIATEATASVPAALLLETVKQAVAFSVGQVGGPVTVKTLAEGVMSSLRFGVLKAWLIVGLFGLALAGGGLLVAGGLARPGEKADGPPARTGEIPEAAKTGTMWKEIYAVENEGTLPVSAAFSADGKTLLTGDTNGEVMALIFPGDDAQYRWKSKADGAHASVAWSADQKKVYATTTNGVRILDPATGRDVARIDAPDSNPIAIGVFPEKAVAGGPSRSQIVFGSASGYFVKSWPTELEPADNTSTIETSIVPKGEKRTDAAAVPLAVDPKGRCVIMTGPRDATGKHVLWAYVCGDYSKDSPGNRLMVGHTVTVVSAAWSKQGTTAVTGDAEGRVIVWDATTMKESRRVEIGARVMALAITDDGRLTAAYVRGKRGGEVYVWETARPASPMRPIHTQLGDLGPEPYASLAFSPDGKRLAGCAIDKTWRDRPKALRNGKVRVWELAAEPKAQRPPKHLYTRELPKGSSSNFVILDNHTILLPSAKEGAIDCRDVRDGATQVRLGLGKFTIGTMKLSSDRKWLAMEQHLPVSPTDFATDLLAVEVGVYEASLQKAMTVPSCSQLLDVASGGKAVAVVREKQIELWDIAAAKKLKSAPFKYTRIDAAQFSPDGRLLAISDRNELVLWRWEENTHERIDLGRCVGSLAFTPDGKFLAEGPTPRDNLQVRDLETRKVVQVLAPDAKRLMNVPQMAYTQGGRVLIACDNITLVKEIVVQHRIHLWDTASGSIAHQIALPAGLPYNIDVTPNGRYLAAALDDGEAGMKLSVWRLDGERPLTETGPQPPAAGPRGP
jgi:RNA polymerase sigma factor (sigma-70 family)